MAQLAERDDISKFRSVSGIPSTQQRQQQLACDRCRGQKLRCIRARDLSSSCERCLKAGAICIFNPSIRMGRPQRSDKRQVETGIASQRKHQRASPSASSKTHQVSSPTDFSGTTKDEIAWYPDALDPKPEDTKLHVYPFVLFSPDDMVSSNNFDFILDQEHQALPFDPMELQFEEHLPQIPTDTSAHIAALSCTERERINTHVADTEVSHVFHQTRQTLVERVSSLNLELLQQLSIMNPTTKDKKVEYNISTSPRKFNDLSAVTTFMVQKLHAFQELLLEISGSLRKHSLEDTTTSVSPAMPPNNHETHNTMENNIWQNIQLSSPDMLSLTDSVSDTPVSPAVEQSQEKAILVNNNIQINAKNNKDQMIFLDIPTSLLIISCYINLIHLCRDIFAAIRESLLSSDHKTIFTTLSGFQISGISLQQDTDLQIIVLTQAVVKLVDKIDRSLGSPFGTTSEDSEKSEEVHCNRAILPRLLNFVLRMEDIRGERLDRAVTEALKDEIRKLNKVVYKSV